MSKKLNVVLAVTDSQASSYKQNVKDYLKFFKDKQGQFKGEKKTYTPADGMIDVPSERGIVKVVTTVDEKLEYLEDTHKEYIDNLFALEATNASGGVRAPLIVDGVKFGDFSSLELLRLKNLLENGELDAMYQSIPVRSDSEVWNKTSNEDYSGRDIYESPMVSGEKKSTTKESYILSDPNVALLKNTDSYKPQIASKDTIITLGSYTRQLFSGEWSHRERAEVLKRKSKLLNAVIEAIKVANDTEVVESEMTANKLFTYLHKG